ncbi:unnamed protein product, partial [Ixodes hexagonus]
PQGPTFTPEVHGIAHEDQRTAALLALDVLKGSFKNKQGYNQQYLDLGCGTGHFTREVLLNRCLSIARIVAADVAVDMIQFAHDHCSHPRITYDLLDIREDVSGFVAKHGKFDRVYSFFALHWMKDQLTTFKNIANLLADDGECLLLFAARTTWLTVYRRLTEKHPGELYSQVLDTIIPQSQDVKDKVGLTSYILNALKSANLKPQTCEVLSFEYNISEPESLIQNEAMWNPVAPLLPGECRPKFIEALTEEIRNLWSEEANGNGVPRYFSDVFLVHASKL